MRISQVNTNMNKADIIAALGEPHRILPPGARRMVSAAWLCSNCSKVHRFPEPVRVPAPCDDCGGIAFEMHGVDQLPVSRHDQ